MNRLLLSFFFIACANISTAQVSDNFEFIDHKVRTARHGVSTIMGNDFIYVSHNEESFPMTSVIKVNTLDNSIDTLLTTFSSTSTIKDFGDGNFQIFITSIVDYDWPFPGFYSIHSDGNNIEVDSVLTIDEGNYEDWNDATFPRNAILSNDGDYYFTAHGELMRINEDLQVDTLYEVHPNLKFHMNSNKKIYSFNSLQLFEVNDTSQVLTLEFDEFIKDIKVAGEYNDVLLVGRVERWTSDFSQKISEWVLPEELNSFSKIDVDSMNVTGLIQDGNRFTINNYDQAGEASLVYENEYVNQGINGFHKLSDSKLLLIGNDSIADVNYSTLFFRNIDYNHEIEYQSRDVSIDSLNLYQFMVDSIFYLYDNSSGDSIYFVFYHTELDLYLTNRSDSIIQTINPKSKRFYQWLTPRYVDYSLDNLNLLPGESYHIHDTLVFRARFNNLNYAIPGADFRFNRDPSRITFPNFTSDVDELVLHANLKLYPNPTSDILHIEIDQTVKSMAIYNSQGQLSVFKSSGADLNKVDVSRLEAGIYYIKLDLGRHGAYAIQKFIKVPY